MSFDLEKKCEVWGIEPLEELYEEALAGGYKKIFNLTAEEFIERNEIGDEKFDVILLGDVLEHMAYPDAVLVGLKNYDINPKKVKLPSCKNIL